MTDFHRLKIKIHSESSLVLHHTHLFRIFSLPHLSTLLGDFTWKDKLTGHRLGCGAVFAEAQPTCAGV